MVNKVGNSSFYSDVGKNIMPKSKLSGSSSYSDVVKKIVPESKLSQGHVEMIISMILFVGFIILIFVFINPFTKTEDKSNVAENIEKVVVGSISNQIGMLSIIIGDPTRDCYDIPVEYGNKFVEYYDTTNPRKYIIYFSDLFPIGTKSCISHLERNYSLGVYTTEDLIIYEKVVNIKHLYETDYNSLKNSLKIGYDFSFNFKYFNNTNIPEISVNKVVPAGLNVKAIEYPVMIIDNNGKIQNVILNIKVW